MTYSGFRMCWWACWRAPRLIGDTAEGKAGEVWDAAVGRSLSAHGDDRLDWDALTVIGRRSERAQRHRFHFEGNTSNRTPILNYTTSAKPILKTYERLLCGGWVRMVRHIAMTARLRIYKRQLKSMQEKRPMFDKLSWSSIRLQKQHCSSSYIRCEIRADLMSSQSRFSNKLLVSLFTSALAAHALPCRAEVPNPKQ